MIEPAASCKFIFVDVASLDAVILMSVVASSTALPISSIGPSITLAVTPDPLSIVSFRLKFVPPVTVYVILVAKPYPGTDACNKSIIVAVVPLLEPVIVSPPPNNPPFAGVV